MDRLFNDFTDSRTPDKITVFLGAFRGIGLAVLPLYCFNGNMPSVKCIYDLPSYAER